MNENEIKLLLMKKRDFENEVWEKYKGDFKEHGVKGGMLLLEGLVSRIASDHVYNAVNLELAIEDVVDFASAIIRISLSQGLLDMSDERKIQLFDELQGWMESRVLE